MLDYSENTCYLKVVRPPTKSIKHCSTGATQVERVSFEDDHLSLEYSIRHSKMLTQYRNKYPFNAPFQPQQAEQLLACKGITDEKSKFYVKKTLRELHSTLYAAFFIGEKKKLKYNLQNQTHEKKLLAIWSNLKPTEKLKSRVSSQWIEIGFQVEDPSTDFRGAGELGLENLYEFSKTEKCKKVFKIASSEKTEYFFASAGLFFTMLGSELLCKHRLGFTFVDSGDGEGILKQFQKIYEMLFCEFSTFWVQRCSNKSIMYFNQNLKNFSSEVNKWNLKLLNSRIQQISQLK